ncbi:protein-tyrosine-phosphatase PTP1-like [Hibiscus syriacus]|uniref:Protein-tyrosine-phosphatase PTP1-like n=1 Tax=Hibiscus syriacus TaxID=106335 RepID=A0A6A2YY08_HIBSY|nr:protein-tyrosine-phosphatase PTP1-like [Hibiscus syriacus]
MLSYELYHELHALDRFEQDYRRKLQEEDNSTAAQRGDSLSILRAELKSQKKHVMEKLVDVVHFLHLEIHEAFGSAEIAKRVMEYNVTIRHVQRCSNWEADSLAKSGIGGEKPVKDSVNSHKKLGSAGLALHYANIITQIDTLVSRSSSVPPNTRDSLYQGLPPTIKSALRFRLQSFQIKEELTVTQIKAEMEKTLQWLVPIATNTTKAHHGFGWVGEWANTGSEVNHKPAGQTGLLRIETLHHADKEKTEVYILDLVVWLHHLVTQARPCNGGIRSPVKSPIRSPNQKMVQLSTQKPASPMLTVEDQEMLRDVSKRKNTPGISKSQEFDTAKTRLSKHHRLSKSSSHSPTIETKKGPFPIRRLSSVPFINFYIDRMKALDVIDRVDTL